MKEDLREQLKELVVRYSKKKISAQQLTDDVLLIEELGFDSVGLVELVVEIEKQYQVDFLDENMLEDTLGRFGTLAACVEKLMEGKDHA